MAENILWTLIMTLPSLSLLENIVSQWIMLFSCKWVVGTTSVNYLKTDNDCTLLHVFVCVFLCACACRSLPRSFLTWPFLNRMYVVFPCTAPDKQHQKQHSHQSQGKPPLSCTGIYLSNPFLFFHSILFSLLSVTVLALCFLLSCFANFFIAHECKPCVQLINVQLKGNNISIMYIIMQT